MKTRIYEYALLSQIFLRLCVKILLTTYKSLIKTETYDIINHYQKEKEKEKREGDAKILKNPIVLTKKQGGVRPPMGLK
mgnify:CR=1 FL=1